MSKLNKIFQSIPVPIPDRSGFDLSHEVLTTATTGTVVPITHIEVLPGDTISMGSMMKVTLPPFAVPFMGRIDAELTAAFIPNRLLWNGWQSFITQNNGVNVAGAQPPFRNIHGELVPQIGPDISNVPIRVPTIDPYANYSQCQTLGLIGPGSLANYLGVKLSPSTDPSVVAQSGSINALPFLAYHKFMDDWCRDENNMKPYFPKMFDPSPYTPSGTPEYSYDQYPNPHLLPYVSNRWRDGSTMDNYRFTLDATSTTYVESDGITPSPNWPYDSTLYLGSLRQRCWSKDYFTTATTRPQAGADSQVLFDVTSQTDPNTGDILGSGGFTIATLRSANSLQKWLERNSIGGTEYGSQILAHFGVTPPDTVLNRSLLLGSVRTPVVISSVENTSNAEASNTLNPYGSTLGTAAGFGSGFDKGNLVDNFTAKEHGYIMVFFTLIPHQYYNTGFDRSLLHLYVGDYAWPEFAGIGDQEIYNAELTTNPNVFPTGTWGYQQRYVEYKHKLDSITGLLMDGYNLAPYALQRGFNTLPDLGKEFLEIPTNYLDQVLGVSTEVGGFGCIVDAYFDTKAVRVLPEYSLPHL